MTYQMFVNLLGSGTPKPSLEEFQKINYVYENHPAVDGISVIKNLYEHGGMMVIEDMLPRARKADCNCKMLIDLHVELNGIDAEIRAHKLAITDLERKRELTEMAINSLRKESEIL